MNYLIAIELGICLGLSIFLTWFAVSRLRKVVSNVVEEGFLKHKRRYLDPSELTYKADNTKEILHELRKIEQRAEIKTEWNMNSLVKIGDKYYRITRIIADQERDNIETINVEAVKTFVASDVRGETE